jgi:hypothetical protein
MKMYTALLCHWRGGEERIEHKTFPAPYATMQVNPGTTAAQPAPTRLQKRRKPLTEMVNGCLLCTIGTVTMRREQGIEVAANQ